MGIFGHIFSCSRGFVHILAFRIICVLGGRHSGGCDISG